MQLNIVKCKAFPPPPPPPSQSRQEGGAGAQDHCDLYFCSKKLKETCEVVEPRLAALVKRVSTTILTAGLCNVYPGGKKFKKKNRKKHPDRFVNN